MSGPLAGLRIFDLTRILAGPTATQVLGDLGADVIKVERPAQGDDTRKWGPPYLKDADGRDTSESAYFLAANRNKRSITIDLEQAEGQALARRLIGRCDILFENFKVGGLAKYGLAYDQLKDECPRLIYCSLTGFGQTGPYAPRAGYDLLAQAMGGLMSITGERDGPPVKVGVGIADLVTGLYCVSAILAALHHRHTTGLGQHVDLALLDSQVSFLVNEGLNHLVGGGVPKAWGTEHATIVPYGAFPTADGHVILAIGNDGQFRKFCVFAGAPALADDPRFATNSERLHHRDAVAAAVDDLTRRHPTAHWVDGLAPLGVPCGPVNTIDKVFQDPQVVARGMTIAMDHPKAGGPVPLIASPIRMSRTPVEYRHAPPTLGQHTDEVLREMLALSEAEIARLRAGRII